MQLLRAGDPQHPLSPPVMLGSLGGVGFAPILRGTAGSAVTAVAAWAAAPALNAAPYGWWIAAAAVSALSFLAGLWVIKGGHGRGDPSWFVLDEAAGLLLLLALLGRPQLADFCLAFVAFRIYDMAKPWPVCAIEGLPGSLGILADDLAAAALGAWTIFCVRWFVQLG